MAKKRLKRLSFKTRDQVTGEIKNTGYVEMKNSEDEELEFPPKEDEDEEKAKEEKVALYFYGDITGAKYEDWKEEDRCPKDVQEFFDEIPENAALEVYVNSGGGDAYAGIAISNIIRRHKGKTTGHVDGLAASAASVIVAGCDEVIIHSGGQFMIHKPMTIAWGNADDLTDAIKRLDACQDCLVDVYMTKAKPEVTREKIVELVNAETWFGAESAQMYFDFKTDETMAAVAAHSNFYDTYKHAPKNLLKKKENNTEDIVAAVLKALDDREERKEAKEKAELQNILKEIEKYGK